VATGLIGIGNRGSFLLQGVLRQPNAKVVALCDNKPDRLDKAATTAARDNPSTYPHWRKLIDRKDVDAVFIATPPYLHSEMAIAAIKAGKHVYCEKPVGVTPQQVRDLLAAAKGSTKVFVAGQQLRSQKQLGEAVRKIREGVIGDVLMVKAQRHASADLAHDGSSADWYFDVKKSGGYLIEQSVHNLVARTRRSTVARKRFECRALAGAYSTGDRDCEWPLGVSARRKRARRERVLRPLEQVPRQRRQDLPRRPPRSRARRPRQPGPAARRAPARGAPTPNR
jgi:hypothetical protein